MCVVAPAPATPYLGSASDERLVVLFRGGDERAFTELDRRHRREVCALAGRMLRGRADPEDVAQDVMVRGAALLRASDEAGAYLRPWLMRVTRNRVIDLLRAQRAPEALPHDLVAPSDVDSAVQVRDHLGRVLVAMADLPERQRRALVLHAADGASHRAVADALDITPQAARALTFRGRSALRRRLATAHPSTT